MVTRRLMDALQALRSAAERTRSGDSTAFEDAVAAGVSANLCEAVAGLVDQPAGIDIAITWARTRPTPEIQRKVTFSSRDADVLREAARSSGSVSRAPTSPCLAPCTASRPIMPRSRAWSR